MKKNLFFLAVLAFSALTANAQTKGELGFQGDGVTPAYAGQATNDHLFVRSNDTPIADNIVSFGLGDTQTVWFWLNDDAIYQDSVIQALPPIPYNASTNLYNEITYNALQCEIYLPQGIVLAEDPCVHGIRLPMSSQISFSKSQWNRYIDGIEYSRYFVVITNANSYGSHFSGSGATMYEEFGALKKDDGPLFGLNLVNLNQAVPEDELSNMIIAKVLLNIRETTIAGWNANQSNFFYGTGGNNYSQCFYLYHRVRLFGSNGLPEGDTNGDGSFTIADVTMLIDYLLSKSTEYYKLYDIDGDGRITIADVVELIDLLLEQN